MTPKSYCDQQTHPQLAIPWTTSCHVYSWRALPFSSEPCRMQDILELKGCLSVKPPVGRNRGICRCHILRALPKLLHTKSGFSAAGLFTGRTSRSFAEGEAGRHLLQDSPEYRCRPASRSSQCESHDSQQRCNSACKHFKTKDVKRQVCICESSMRVGHDVSCITAPADSADALLTSMGRSLQAFWRHFTSMAAWL